MYSTITKRKSSTVLALLALLCQVQAGTAFAPTSVISHGTRIRPRALVASPFEEMEKESQKKGDDDNNDTAWTEVEGGFLPRIGRLQRQKIIVEVDNLVDYKKEVVDCKEEIVVVKFYSTWCRSCKAMAPLYKKMAKELTAGNKSIKFVQVPVKPENAVLHQGLGVPSVPFGHIYHKGAGLVEELSLNKKEFRVFKDALKSYVDGDCELLP